MYATPIAYPVSYLSEKSKFAYLINYNPLTSIVEGFRYAVFGTSNFHFTDLSYSFIWIIVSLSVGVVVFNRTEKSFMDTV
jgi:lipopolysaccharide transport system permease protein